MAPSRDQPADHSAKPLQTNRPWLTVAGCLGGSVLTLVIIALVLLLVVLWVLFPDWFDFGQRQRTVQARVIGALGELAEKPALRVATREIAVQVEVKMPTEVTWRPWVLPIGRGFDLKVGETTATVTSPSNTVQYVVPLDHMNRARIAGPDGTGAVTIWLPPPVVDGALVDVESDPSKIDIAINRDWADHVFRSDAARNAALAAVRESVVQQASSPVAMFEVREKSRKTVAEMIRALIDDKHRPEQIIVRWTDESAAD
jgi:hypothetical protein